MIKSHRGQRRWTRLVVRDINPTRATEVIENQAGLFLRQAQDGFIHEGVHIPGRAKSEPQRGILLRLGGGHQGDRNSTCTGGQDRFKNGLDGTLHFQ